MRVWCIFLAAMCCSLNAFSDRIVQIEIEIPDIEASPYFRPYVAIWAESLEREPVESIAVWYQTELKPGPEGDGKKWLKDMRQWWRKLGRESPDYVDGVTGATRKPGVYQLSWQVPDSLEGAFLLNFEAAREEGGRSYQRVEVGATAQGEVKVPAENELGFITIQMESAE